MKIMTRSMWIMLLGIIIIPAVYPALLSAQRGDEPYFEAQLQTYRPDDLTKSGLKVHISVRRDDLLFLKKEEHFEAAFEINVVLWNPVDGDPQGEIVYDKTQKKTVLIQEYDETNRVDVYHDWIGSLELDPGQYSVQAIVTDVNSDRIRIREYKVDLQSYGADKLYMSQMLLLDGIKFDDDGMRRLIPHKSHNITQSDSSVLAYAEIYTKEKDSPLEIRYNVRENMTEKRLQVKQGSWTLARHEKQDFIITDITEFDLPIGSYRLIIEVTEGEQKTTSATDFTMHLEGLPPSIGDLAVAIEQLRYIAQKDEMKKLRSDLIAVRLEEFKDFWKRRGPTPLTDENENMYEYYRRARYVAEQFSVFRKGDGWKTDRGMVFMMYGPPNDVERRDMVGPTDGYVNSQYTYSEPSVGMFSYEVWNYWDSKYDPVVEFVDESNTGDFHLLNYTEVSRWAGFRGVMFDGRGSDMLPRDYDDDEDNSDSGEGEENNET